MFSKSNFLFEILPIPALCWGSVRDTTCKPLRSWIYP